MILILLPFLTTLLVLLFTLFYFKSTKPTLKPIQQEANNVKLGTKKLISIQRKQEKKMLRQHEEQSRLESIFNSKETKTIEIVEDELNDFLVAKELQLQEQKQIEDELKLFRFKLCEYIKINRDVCISSLVDVFKVSTDHIISNLPKGILSINKKYFSLVSDQDLLKMEAMIKQQKSITCKELMTDFVKDRIYV